MGETLDVVVGIADDKVLVAVGRDAAKTLKKAIDQSKSNRRQGSAAAADRAGRHADRQVPRRRWPMTTQVKAKAR